LSHDQRPGKLRVVQDGGPKQGAKNPVTIDGKAVTVTGPSGAPTGQLTAGGAQPAAKQGLPILLALLFLVACTAGGVAVALVRPFGLG
jgi:hypothetical protein